jgi:hypothetical protein
MAGTATKPTLNSVPRRLWGGVTWRLAMQQLPNSYDTGQVNTTRKPPSSALRSS